MQILTIILSMVSFVISFISLIMGIISFIELRSFMKSTHKIEYLPLDQNLGNAKEPMRDEELDKFGIL